jgi:hypothetical protein
MPWRVHVKHLIASPEKLSCFLLENLRFTTDCISLFDVATRKLQLHFQVKVSNFLNPAGLQVSTLLLVGFSSL